MSWIRPLVLAAVVCLAGCAGLQPRTLPPARDADSVGNPVFQPMMVVPMPSLRTARAAGRPVEAMVGRDTPVRDVLLTLFRDSDVNLLLDPAIGESLVTFDIKESTVEEAFEALLRSLDLGYTWDGSFLRISNRQRETFYVDLLSSQSAQGSGASGGSSGGSSGSGSTQQTDFWASLQNSLDQVLGADARVVINQAASTVHVEAAPSGVERMRELVDTTLRRRNTQVSLEARILEVRLDDEYRLGVNWSLLPGLFRSNKTGLAQGGSIVSQVAASGGSALNFGMLEAGDFSVFMDALESQGQVRVLSSPRVSTMNNVPAEIRVVDQIPVIDREVLDDQGVARTEYSVRFVEAGVSVTVTPMIGEDGMVTVQVSPQVTEQTGTVVTPDGLVTEPILSTRSSSAIVRVADGQAIVLGGLRSTRKSESRSGVPFLMDVPFLGQLFSSTVQEREEMELMIMLVPRVLESTWIDEEIRRGAHRLVSLRNPFQWNPLRIESFRPEDWSGGLLQGEAAAAGGPEARVPVTVPESAGDETGLTVTRGGLAARLMERAQHAIDDGQHRPAIALLEQAVQLQPRSVAALVACGVLMDRYSNRTRARMYLDRAVAIDGSNPAALTARGALELVEGSPFSARRYLAAAHGQVGDAVTATNLAAAMLMCGESEGGRALLRGVVDDSSPPELHANLGYAEMVTGDLAAARQSLERAMTAGADPRNPRITALQRMVEAAERAAAAAPQ